MYIKYLPWLEKLYMCDFWFSTSVYQDPVNVNIITVLSSPFTLSMYMALEAPGLEPAYHLSQSHYCLIPLEWCHNDVKSHWSLDSVYALRLSDKVLGLWWQLAPSSLLHTSPGPPPDSLHHQSHSLVCVVWEKGGQLALTKVRIVGAFCFPAFPVSLVQLVDLKTWILPKNEDAMTL